VEQVRSTKTIILAPIILTRRRSTTATAMTIGIRSRRKKLSREEPARIYPSTPSELITWHRRSRGHYRNTRASVLDEGEPFDSELPSLRADRDAVAQTARLFRRKRTRVYARFARAHYNINVTRPKRRRGTMRRNPSRVIHAHTFDIHASVRQRERKRESTQPRL